MLKTALLLLAVTLAVLTVLAVLPDRQRALPEQQIELHDASVILYPEADPDAVWRFDTPEASYDPDRAETILYRTEEGRREVAGEVDFTIASERLTIDRHDNLLGDLVFAFLVETGECLTMRGTPQAPVTIDQGRGIFEVPVLEISGPSWGDETRLERMRVSFDLEEFEGGGAGTTTVTEFRVGRDDEAIRSTVCEKS